MSFDFIIDIIKEKKFISENWVKKNYPDFHFFILNLFSEDIIWKAKFYLYVNDIKSVPYCYCGNINKYRSGKFTKYCSTKCLSNDPNVKKKIKGTNISKYGVDMPLKNKVIKQKAIETWKENLGVDNPGKSEKVKEQVRKTNLKKFGVEYVSQLDSIKESLSDKMKENRGYMTICKRESISDNLEFKVKHLNIDFIKIVDMSLYEFFCNVCNSEFIITKNNLNDRIRNKNTVCTNCNKVGNMDSDSERLLYEFVKENYKGIIIKNDRSVLNGKELDIYLPDINLAIEFNGIYWHSEIYKEKDYHFNKSKLCKESDIKLIHIWEDDWVNKEYLVKSNILNLINTYENVLINEEIINNSLIKIYLYSDDLLIGNIIYDVNKSEILTINSLYNI
jgi:G:T-mismatch repair DNA endonuclease (very short patch repair protein)